MAIKRAQTENETLGRLNLDIEDVADCARSNPRLPALADRVTAFIQAAAGEGAAEDQPVSHDLVALLAAAFIESLPCPSRLLELLAERGWTGWTGRTGWTNIRRMTSAP